FSGKVAGISPWSAESPKLYEIEFELIDPQGKSLEVITQRIGFRSVQVEGKELLVNGKPIILYGVNRHDFNKETGRVLTRELMRADLLELKRWNFNAIRTSHYPNDPVFLDLCDELGFYVIGEANIESHAFQDSICDDQKYLNAFVDRVARMVQPHASTSLRRRNPRELDYRTSPHRPDLSHVSRSFCHCRLRKIKAC
ncbi:MAG: hypothetical protein RL287_841, partial [Actinomycetota bacterium]